MVEVRHRPAWFGVAVTDYKLGAIKFHEDSRAGGYMALLKLLLGVARAIWKRIKEVK